MRVAFDMICANENKAVRKDFDWEFIPVQSSAMRKADGGIAFYIGAKGEAGGIGSRIVLGAFKYSYGGRVGSRCVSPAKGGAPRNYVVVRRLANVRRRCV